MWSGPLTVPKVLFFLLRYYLLFHRIPAIFRGFFYYLSESFILISCHSRHAHYALTGGLSRRSKLGTK